MSVTRKDLMEFAFHMGRHTRATPSQVQRLLRYAATLQRLAEDDCNLPFSVKRTNKKLRCEARVKAICDAISPVNQPDCVPVFSGDPRGCVLKIRVPDGFSDSFGGEGICVPA